MPTPLSAIWDEVDAQYHCNWNEASKLALLEQFLKEDEECTKPEYRGPGLFDRFRAFLVAQAKAETENIG